MLNFLPSVVVGSLASVLLVINVLFWATLLFGLSLIKFILPFDGVRKRLDPILAAVGSAWIKGNGVWMSLTQRTQWLIEGDTDLSKKGWYLVSANHQSWVDIFAIQRALNGKVPFVKFFLKKELIYVPVMGLAWWALDFPFMKRHSKQYLKKHPEKRGSDLAATQKACRKFSLSPTSVMNFLEGTRFTQEKHDRQSSPYTYLLKPKSGGIAYAIEALGDRFQSMLDITIIYPENAPSFWDFLAGRVSQIKVIIKQRTIPSELMHGSYQQDSEYRKSFQQWVNQVWAEKDELIKSEKAKTNQNG